MVLGFGYVVAAGPVGFLSLWAQALIGFVPWNIYDMSSIVVIAGLTHVPHAYLYISSALRSVGSDVEEAARIAGASPLQVMTAVSLPMVRPSILYAVVLLFFLGLEVFGLMLVLGDPEGNMVLATRYTVLSPDGCGRGGTDLHHHSTGHASTSADAHRQPFCHRQG